MTVLDSGGEGIVQRLASRHEQLQSRRLVQLPLNGSDAPQVEAQGRGWGPQVTFAASDIDELVSSMGQVGQLQPVLVEEVAPDQRLLVAGERRLRAMRILNVRHGGNPRYETIAAVVVDGPLSDEERRSWQLIENLARSDLKPGELAAALLYERCALLAARIQSAGVDVPRSVLTCDDPVDRFDRLDKLRVENGLFHLGATWQEVIKRIGIQLSVNRAKEVVRAFKALPAELSADMDEADVTAASRSKFVGLHRDRKDAAEEIWAALAASGQASKLMSRAVYEATRDDALSGTAAVELAAEAHVAANQARADTHRRRVEEEGGDPSDVDADCSGGEATISQDLVATFVDAGQEILNELRSGKTLPPYDNGSVALVVEELNRRTATTSKDGS